MMASRRARLMAMLVLAVALALVGVSAAAGQEGTGGGTLLVSNEANPDFLDSALADSPASWQILAATGDGLLAYRQVTGRAGASLVSDIAESLPAVSDGGRTLTFVVRKGVMFGPPVDREVTASDVKASLERLFLLDSRGKGLYGTIVGASALMADGHGGLTGITADDRTGRLVIRLVRPDPALLGALALPFAFVVPKETPAIDQSAKPPVATGPYMVRDYEPNRQIDITRNPNFSPWTQDRPDGHVERISIRIGVPRVGAIGQIVAGTLDMTQSELATALLPTVRGTGTIEARRTPLLATDVIFMNPQAPPFDDRRVRLAVAAALQRGPLMQAIGGDEAPAAQILPPYVPGHRPLHLPRVSLGRGRALVQAAGTTGTSVRVWGDRSARGRAVSAALVQLLDRLGLRASRRLVDPVRLRRIVLRPGAGAQIGYARLGAAFPDGSQLFAGSQLGDDPPNGAYLHLARAGAVDRQVVRALGIWDAARRAAAWAGVDRATLSEALAVPVATPLRTDVSSTRVADYVVSPVYGPLWTTVTLR